MPIMPALWTFMKQRGRAAPCVFFSGPTSQATPPSDQATSWTRTRQEGYPSTTSPSRSHEPRILHLLHIFSTLCMPATTRLVITTRFIHYSSVLYQPVVSTDK